MPKPKILLQLDTDPQPSVFDAVVAIDAGAEHLLRHGNVTADGVRDLIYGGMFTRGPADLAHTAVFIGGTNVAAAEEIFKASSKHFSARCGCRSSWMRAAGTPRPPRPC